MDGAALAGVEPNKGLEELAPPGRVNGLAAAGVPDDCDSEVLAPPKERPPAEGGLPAGVVDPAAPKRPPTFAAGVAEPAEAPPKRLLPLPAIAPPKGD